MRTITLIVIHCSGNRPDHRYTFEQCRRDHIEHNHWKDIGYHWYIELDGSIHQGRPEGMVGAHCKDHNQHSLGICYEGGIDHNGHPADTRTEAQKASLRTILKQLKGKYPNALIVSHHTFNPQKACPCFDAEHEYLQL